jgi:CBS domain-containing protein
MTRVENAMSREVRTACADATVHEAAQLMAQHNVGCLVVVKGRSLMGIFTERDIVRALSHDVAAASQQIAQWMTREPETIAPTATINEARRRMLRGKFRHLPVTEGDSVVGIVSMRDLSPQSRGRVVREQ